MTWGERLARWWAEFSLQTKLLAVATLVVSLVMAGITFRRDIGHQVRCRPNSPPT